MQNILCHEQTHIKRFDHIVRFISYLVLGIHWFNPLVWIAFYLSGKDMEMACDESVIEQLGSKVKTNYSQSLLNFSSRDYKLNLSPLAFGEGNTKGRVVNVLKYRKPKFYISIIGIIVLLIASLVLLSNPITILDDVSERGNVLDNGLNLYIWVKEDLTGNEDVYYTLLSQDANNNNEDLYSEVYNMDIAIREIAKTIEDIKGNQVGTNINLNFVNMMPQRIINSVSLEFIDELVGYPVKVSIGQPIEINSTGTQGDNYTVLQQILDATEEKLENINNILGDFDIQCVELKISENPVVKGMDTNWIAYDIITENGASYVLIVRKHDKDFTALIDNNNRQLTGILDNGILPETYNLIN